MFPNGWPGRGLFLLRLVVLSLVAFEAIASLFNGLNYVTVVQQVVAILCAFLLLIGLATPFAAIALSLCELWIVVSNIAQWPIAMALGGIAFALAMLGPGSISIDARLFGRKRIEFPRSDPI